MPGPACYGKGGDQPTVTDANVVLGRLPPSLLGGEMRLDVKASEDAVSKIARALGLDTYQAAQGILDIVNENMFGALRLLTVQKGLDPRDFAMVAFGGAGPLHGNALGTLAGCFPVIVPPTPGVLSALGFLHSDVKKRVRANLHSQPRRSSGRASARRAVGLGQQARVWLQEEGIDEGRQSLHFEVDVRYFRQGYEFSLDVGLETLSNGGLGDVADRFGAAHERLYGFRLEQPVELVNLRAVGTGSVTKIRTPKSERGDADASAAVVEQHRVFFDGNFVTANIYDRAELCAGNHINGPAVVMQKDTTTVIHPGHVGEVDEYLNILIWPEGARH